MTREEAIQELQNCKGLIQQDGQDYLDERDIPLLDMAIEALSADAVSLTGTMKYLTKPHNYCEVVRCKDCKNWRESHSEDEESYCYIDGRTTDSTDFCSWGERREP
jgi:hypothetical protein